MNILKFAAIAFLLATSATACNDDDSVPVDEYTLNISGDSNGDFFADGKSWIAEGRDLSTNNTTSQYRTLKFTVVGDTIVGGVKAKKIQSELLTTGEKSPDYRIGYENNNVIYIWLNNAFRPILDFNIDPTKKIFLRDTNGNISQQVFLITRIGSTIKNIEGHDRKLFEIFYDYTDDFTGPIPTIFFQWIENIGSYSNDGFITDLNISQSPDRFWNYNTVTHVYQNGQCIYDIQNLYHD